MGDPTKKVRFEYLVPYYLTQDVDGKSIEKQFYLTPLFCKISEQTPTATQQRIYGEKHLISKCVHDTQNHLWEVQLLHYREKVFPGKANENGAFELIHLDEGEYVAESTTLLYDETKNNIYLQRNIYGSSVRAVTELIMRLAPEDTRVILKPKYNPDKIGKISRVLDISKVVLVADSGELQEDDKASSIGGLLSSFGRYNGDIIKFELGNGRSRKKRLNKAEVVSLIQEAYSFSGTQKLELKAQWTEDSAFETIDLMDDRAAYIFNVSYSRNDPITHARLCALCRDKVLNTR